MVYYYGIGFIAALLAALIMTPMVKRFAIRIGAVDAPNQRKVHTRIMPRLGGLAIFIAFIASFAVIYHGLDYKYISAAWSLVAGGFIIVLLGAMDDKFDLSPRVKLLVQIVAACVVVYLGGLRVDFINIPFGNANTYIQTWLSIPLTILWIVGVTNAINLIDGLDGLAGGVSAIATATIMVMALMLGNATVVLLSLILLGSIIGFLFFNFYPAKIFMGDSGALFLGFCIATLSILGFKQVTFISFIIPLFIIGVPLSDTLLALLRRWIHKEPLFTADKGHLHHCLMRLGLSHRNTVLVIYGISIFFGLCAIALSQATLWVTVVVTAVILLILILGAEAIGIISRSKKPVLQFLSKFLAKGLGSDTPPRN